MHVWRNTKVPKPDCWLGSGYTCSCFLFLMVHALGAIRVCENMLPPSLRFRGSGVD